MDPGNWAGVKYVLSGSRLELGVYVGVEVDMRRGALGRLTQLVPEEGYVEPGCEERMHVVCE